MTIDALVVGAGVVGCAVARAAAGSGASVLVVDRQEPGTQASWAAAGMLSPQAEALAPGAFLDLLLRARTLFPELAGELRAETGIDVGYRTDGTLLLAFSADDETELRERAEWQRAAGLGLEALDARQTLALEPSLSPALRGALLFPGDHQVDNRLLTRALWISAARAGARFRGGSGVRTIGRDGDGVVVELEDGERLRARGVVIAAGSWSGQIAGLPRPLPVEPVHGQLLGTAAAAPLLRHVVGSPRGYVVPRADGRIILGTTVDRFGFDAAVTLGGMQQIVATALEIAPTLADHRLTAHWSSFRPGTPDRLPVLGPDPEAPAILYATGHYRNGILLAPLTGQLIAACLRGETPAVDLAPFRPDRFQPAG